MDKRPLLEKNTAVLFWLKRCLVGRGKHTRREVIHVKMADVKKGEMNAAMF
jgi:hypothetical protein